MTGSNEPTFIPLAPEEKKSGPPQRSLLVEVGQEASLWHEPGADGDAYATISIDGHTENYPIRSAQFRRWIGHKFFKEKGTVAGNQAFEDAIKTLEGEAIFDGEEHPVFTRIGSLNGKNYIDVGDDKWQVIEVSAEGWNVVEHPSIKFRRPAGMRALPLPDMTGSINDLRPFLNVEESDFPLIVTILVAFLLPQGPYPIPVLIGEAGTAKSTTADVLMRLVDPRKAPRRSQPREERDLVVMARNSWCLGFDNLSGLPEWLSDSFCRLSTGGGFSTRRLHTDADEMIFEAQRPIILNGISDLATRHDLASRSIVFNLPVIPDDMRRSEREFWAEFEIAYPLILGALYEAASTALRNVKDVVLEKAPRLADFAQWAVAAEPSFPWPAGTFLDLYEKNRSDVGESSLDADIIGQTVREIAQEGVWKGTASELLEAVCSKTSESLQRSRLFPKTASALSNRVRRVATTLRVSGIDVEFGRIGKDRKRIISIRQSRPAR